MWLQFLKAHELINWQRVRDNMERIVLEVNDPLAILGLQIRIMNYIPLRYFPGPDGSQRRVGFNRVVGRLRHVRSNDLQRFVVVVGGKRTVQGKEFRENRFE